VERLVQDIRHALRLMGRHPGFTAAALITLALGIGANTAIFSIVYGVLFRPLPYRDTDRLVRVWEEHAGARSVVRGTLLSNRTFHAWTDKATTVDAVAVFSRRDFTLTETGESTRVAGFAVTPVLFRLLGVPPAAGRLLDDSDAVPNPTAVVLSHGFWHERFGGDPAIVGRTVMLDGRAMTIVGVADASFFFPDRNARLWVPRIVNRAPTDPQQQSIEVFDTIARLRPGVTREQAAAEATAAARNAGPRGMVADMIFGKGGPVEVKVDGLLDQMTARVRPALILLAVGVGFVMLIACANVANLLLSRGVARQRELAVRGAIGAGRRRLLAQLVTETMVLAAVGGALGIMLGWALTRAIPALAPANFPRLADIRMDASALTFAIAASLVAGLLSGLLPGFRASAGDFTNILRAGISPGTRNRRLGASLLLVEAALCVLLLVSSGLLIRSFTRLSQVEPGYNPSNVLLARVYLSPGQRPPDATSALIDRVLERVRAQAGVVAAGASNTAPFVPATAITGFMIPGTGPDGQPLVARAVSYVVTPGYAEALRLQLRNGRLFERGDQSAGATPMLVNDEFVRTYLSDGNPVIGRQFPSQNAPPREIVGVVGNVLKDGLDTSPQPEIYILSRDQSRFGAQFSLAIRTEGDPLRIAPTLRAAMKEIDPAGAVDDIAPLTARMSASMGQPRFAAAVLGAFALVALGLAATGLYGVLSYQVLQRRREMGVRAALGATRSNLVRLVIREGLLVTIAGLALGLGAAMLLTRLMSGLLFGVQPIDAPSFIGAPLVLLIVALIACLLPARRAARVDPAEALRAE
jgi:putative ABC transport system permease protein